MARAEIARRTAVYRRHRAALSLRDRTVIVVDDGIATGATARAACLAVRSRGADHVVLAVPVAPHGWIEDLGHVADEYIAVTTSASMMSVGEFYSEFPQVDDAEVLAALDSSSARSVGGRPSR